MSSSAAVEVTAKHLASTIHCIDDEIVGWLKRREQASITCFGRAQEYRQFFVVVQPVIFVVVQSVKWFNLGL